GGGRRWFAISPSRGPHSHASLVGCLSHRIRRKFMHATRRAFMERVLDTCRKGAGLLAVLLVILGLAAPLAAQTDVTTSRITGTAAGADKPPLPGVTVEATNTETGLRIAAVTDERGFYRILNLPTGTYKITASLDGFVTSTADNVRVLLGTSPTVNFTLQS